ncbi:MAG: hypothetical protein IT443_11940 [Phycisphaeraceae bacterium]|nr:hypothetical protein [Phycisphaeraceae bacterium]
MPILKTEPRGRPLERLIAGTFPAYAEAKLAQLSVMPVPMAPCGIFHPKHRRMLYVPKGKAPFDVYGWVMTGLGIFIGAELKETRRKTSLSIRMPDDSGGEGMQFHQLHSLASLASAGGLARLVWSNDGELGVLKGERIAEAFNAVWTAWISKQSGKKAMPGSRSIPWEKFDSVAYRPIGGQAIPDWLEMGDLMPGK